MKKDTLLIQATLGDFVEAARAAFMPKEQMQEEVLNNIATNLTDLAVFLGVSQPTLAKVKREGYLENSTIQMSERSVVYDIEKARKGLSAYNRSKRPNSWQ